MGRIFLGLFEWDWKEQISEYVYSYYTRFPSLSPDGEKVAFELVQNKRFYIYDEIYQAWVVNRDGGN